MLECVDMKATFTAFGGKLRSAPIELPDNTTDRFYLPLDMERAFAISKDGRHNGS